MSREDKVHLMDQWETDFSPQTFLGRFGSPFAWFCLICNKFCSRTLLFFLDKFCSIWEQFLFLHMLDFSLRRRRRITKLLLGYSRMRSRLKTSNHIKRPFHVYSRGKSCLLELSKQRASKCLLLASSGLFLNL